MRIAELQTEAEIQEQLIADSRTEGIDIGRTEGIEIGRTEGYDRAILRMLSSGMLTAEQVAEIADVSLKHVDEIATAHGISAQN